MERAAFILGVINGSFYFLAQALIDPNIVIPQFVGKLGPAETLSGLAPAILSGGWFLPQLFIAVYAQGFPYKKPLYSFSAYMRILTMGGVCLAVLTTGRLSPLWTLLTFYSFLILFGLGTGIGGVAFMDMVAKTIPEGRRSVFFSWRLFLGQALAFGGGFAVRAVLRRPDLFPYPRNYALLFAAAWLFYSIAVMTYVFVPEPPSPPRPRKSLNLRWKQALSPLRTDAPFRRLILARLVIYFSGLSLPYYWHFASTKLGAADAMAGTYIASQVAAGALSNALWGRLGDRVGGRAVVIGGAVLAACASGLALFLHLTGPYPPIAMAGVYALAGMALNALTVSGLAYILDMAPAEHREEYIGLHYTLTLPTILAPILAGQLLRFTNFTALFATACALGLFGVAIAWTLPRSRGARL